MDVWMGKCTDEFMDSLVNGYMNEQVNALIPGYMDEGVNEF